MMTKAQKILTKDYQSSDESDVDENNEKVRVVKTLRNQSGKCARYKSEMDKLYLKSLKPQQLRTMTPIIGTVGECLFPERNVW